MLRLGFCVLFLCTWYFSNAQEVFSGRLYYDIEYLNVPDDMIGVDSMLPANLQDITDGVNWRIEQQTMINGTYAEVYIAEKDSIYESIVVGPERVIVNGKKPYKISETVRIGSAEPFVEFGTVIYSSKCETGKPLNLICLETFNPINGLFYEGLEGIPTSVEIEKAGLTMRLSLSKLNREPLDDSYFALPIDYSIVDDTVYQTWLR